jgi:hypothetical protein
MEALRPVAQVPGFLSLLPVPAVKVDVVLPLAAFVKGMCKSSSPMRGCLRRGFLNPSLVVQVTPGSHTAIKGSDFRVNGLTQSQNWPVGFGLSGEVVAWEQGDEVWDGEDGDSLYPLGVLPPDLALAWELDSVKDLDPSLAILEAIEEDYYWELKQRVLRPKVGEKL